MQGPRLELSQRTGLMMTPMMQQAVALLLMSTLELELHVEAELETNPTLELAEPTEAESAPEENKSQEPDSPDSDETAREIEAAAAPAEAAPSAETLPEEPGPAEKEPDELDYANLFSSSPTGTTYDSESENIIEETPCHDILLSDHLIDQLRLAAPPPEIDSAARHIISKLDADGFLGQTADDFAASTGLAPASVEAALGLIKTFDPHGVGALDVREALLMQLDRIIRFEQIGRRDSPVDDSEPPDDAVHIAYKIISDHMDDLSKNRQPAIAKLMAIDLARVTEGIDLIRTLEPRPGRAFGSSDTSYIIPDIVVEKVNGEYIVSLRNDRIPQLRISDYYRRMFEKEKRNKGEVSAYLKSKLDSAYWLIKSIEQRQSTIYRVSESIVRHQIDFLEYGQKYLKPMTLRVVAEDLGIHESTVSRVTTQKYIQTPRGTFELKYFFTSPIGTDSGEDASSRSVKMVLQEIVAAEDPAMPWSDQKLAEMMAERGYTIARRTITKYREQLNILSAKQRIKY